MEVSSDILPTMTRVRNHDREEAIAFLRVMGWPVIKIEKAFGLSKTAVKNALKQVKVINIPGVDVKSKGASLRVQW